MEDTLLIDAAERFANGEMSAEEKTFFEEIRKNNPDVDQLVVEQIFFLNEIHRYADQKNFRHSLHEVEADLVKEGFITRSTKNTSGGNVIQFWAKYKKTITVAASIAGFVSLFIASIVSAVSSDEKTNIKPLVDKLNQLESKTRQNENKVNQLAAASNTPSVPEKPRLDAKFRATGFVIDADNNFIVTNAHVVNEAHNQLIIENIKGEQYNAEAVYVDPASDLAIIKVTDKEFKKLAPMPYGIRRNNAELGEQVFTLGYPKQEVVYGEGYISARNGYMLDTIYFQMSTSANEGNSGSPVINKKGELLGIITSMETNAEGVVFALKSSNIYKAIEEVNKLKTYPAIKLTNTNSSIKNLPRESQIKRLQDYVFMIKGN